MIVFHDIFVSIPQKHKDKNQPNNKHLVQSMITFLGISHFSFRLIFCVAGLPSAFRCYSTLPYQSMSLESQLIYHIIEVTPIFKQSYEQLWPFFASQTIHLPFNASFMEFFTYFMVDTSYVNPFGGGCFRFRAKYVRSYPLHNHQCRVV